MPKTNKKIGLSLVALVLGGVVAWAPLQAEADPLSDYAATEQRLADKAAEARSLADEVSVLDETITAKNEHLTAVSIQVAKTRKELEGVTAELTKLGDDRETAQDRLNRLVRADYLDGRPNAYYIIAGSGTLSSATAATSYLGLFRDKTEDLATRLEKIGQRLSEKRDDVTSRVRHLDDLEAEAVRQRYELEAVRAAKGRLLEATRGQEAEYRRQSDEARQQLIRLGLFGSAGCAEVGGRTWPDTGNYFNQCDSRWAGIKLGFSNSSTIGDYGCGVASLAMVYRHYGIDTDPIRLNESLKRTRAFVDDLLNWRNTAAASGGRVELANSPYPVGRVDWNHVNAQLDSGNPVIVFIDRGQTSHYVTLIGRQGTTYLMHDPIKGPSLRFSDFYSTGAVYQYITFRRT